MTWKKFKYALTFRAAGATLRGNDKFQLISTTWMQHTHMQTEAQTAQKHLAHTFLLTLGR